MHYSILLVDKRKHPLEPGWWSRYTVFESENLTKTAKFYSHLYSMFRNYVVDLDDYTKYDLIFCEDTNYDPDTGTFKFIDLDVLPVSVSKQLDHMIENHLDYSKTWAKGIEE